MPNLEDSRAKFLRKIVSYTHRDDRPRFEAILDDFIAWSTARGGTVEYVDKEHRQGAVSFRESGRGYVLWSAYPRSDDGAKLEILPGAADKISPERRAEALSVLKALTREPIEEDTTLRVSFHALKSQDRRDRVQAVLGELVADLAKPKAAPAELATAGV
ncbi:MAG TPA: hypothetical protein VGT98_17580 [Candidatus Elarobacter sp.]|nr:hypothetical protein [Candidatus Elarobacter sp.]